ncbi:FAD-binding oxidoreductase [Saccharopolyspora karakumensis]|uniref:FAD-binding oxidoreductase n=2 Tax=Saccharopolyspora karakumensis TaxID=2530386 RepID=A0A4R5BCK8_9PSEU|nr:FAD-binding oxidoreductase [Saccharopolyspora karakumensis]
MLHATLACNFGRLTDVPAKTPSDRTTRHVDDEFRRHLSAALPRAARIDLTSRAAYSSDASIYRQMPAAVLEPRDAEEVVAATDIARELGVPVTARGGGTSVAGNAVSPGLVIDFSRHMNAIQHLAPDTRSAVVEPGVILDDLRVAASAHGLTFGPDPSTHSRCTLGGMIGNNACGSHSVAWGTTADNVQALRMLLPDGRRLDARRGTSGDPGVDAELLRLRDANLATVRTELGRFSRQVSGYGLAHLLPERGFDVAKALVGTESTCGVVLSATVQLVETPAARVLLVLGFDDVHQAADCAPLLAKAGALTVEGMDAALVAALRTRPGRSEAGAELPSGQAWLYCEVGGATADEATDAAKALAESVPGATAQVITDVAGMRGLWRIREEGAGIVTRLADGGEAWPGWEDSAVPPENFGAYLRELRALMDDHGRRGVSYGHFGEGCLHLRTDWDLSSRRGLDDYRAFVESAAILVARHGGSISGEHGDGRARSELLSRMYSTEAVAAFSAFKGVFDPENLFNPGVIVDPEPLDANVRPGPGHDRLDLTPVHALHQDGGSFASAVHRCVGVGKCRQTSAGAMCPSYKVTRDEVQSTRGRARALSEMLRGESIPDGWRSTEVRDALDLCLSCKACRNDCPVNVDMATYKAEFLHHHYRRRLRPAAHYSMGWLPLWSRIAARIPRLVNAITTRPAPAALLKSLGGIDPHRDMIRFAEQSFETWFARRPRQPGQAATAGDPNSTVVLWPDTFTNYLAPEVGKAAVEVLEALGYRVELPTGSVCCGLTWHSTGQLSVAQRMLRRSLGSLDAQLAAGYRVVGLEPSCTVMLRDEATELAGAAARLSAQTVTFAELIAEHGENTDDWPFRELDVAAVVQIHCHQEATTGSAADRTVLQRLGVRTDVIGSGCCGLAGNFGFEKGHWDVSQACAELELYPKVRASAPEDLVLADGFSCRAQLAQGTHRSGRHLAEVLRDALR